MKKIAYFINQYPKVSHSFIRREISALEQGGIHVERFALRVNAAELVDAEDKEELSKTQYLLSTPKAAIIATVLALLAKSPALFFSTLWLALSMGLRSDRGLLNHVFYFVEACLLSKSLKEKQVKHVHAHFGTNPATVVMLASKLGGIPYSFTVHGPEEFDKPEFLSLGRKVHSSAFVVAISSYGRSQLYRWVDYQHWPKINVVHCGLDAAFYDIPDLTPNYSSSLVCVGRLCEQKGQLLLVQAVAELVADNVDVHLTLAGDGPMRAEVEALIARHELKANISITGWISSAQVRSEILNARALVLPSFAEGLPVVIMESMALRRPVISTYVAGIPELVKPGNNGWLVPAGDVSKLKETMLNALNATHAELDRLGINARNIVLERHNINTEAYKLSSSFERSMVEGE